MPKNLDKQTFNLGRFPEVGQKQKTEKRRRKKPPKVGNNNGQLRIATPPRVANEKPSGPKKKKEISGKHKCLNLIYFYKLSLF